MTDRERPEPILDKDQAGRLARLLLQGVVREYPNAPGHILFGPEDQRSPRELHPAFYGCYDWHSAVHSHWALIRLLRLFPDLPEAGAIRAVLREHLTAANLRAEAAYLQEPGRRSFERTYGWAWLLKLAEELQAWDDPEAYAWSVHLEPLAAVVVAGYVEFLPKLRYPVRAGTHPNTAFGLAFALDFARACGEGLLESLIVEKSLAFFESDADAPAAWEPSAFDFLSPSLVEADLLSRVLPRDAFVHWFERFLPRLVDGEPRSLLEPAVTTDRSDPLLVHLDGLNLSRAWCMRRIARALGDAHPAAQVLEEAAARHARAGIANVFSGEYAGEHWLGSFAVYLLGGAGRPWKGARM